MIFSGVCRGAPLLERGGESEMSALAETVQI